MSSILIVIFRDLNSLIDFFSFTTWIFYTLAFASYFALRYKEPHAERPFRVRNLLLICELPMITFYYLGFAWVKIHKLRVE